LNFYNIATRLAQWLKAGKNPDPIAQCKYNSALGQVKIKVWWSGGQVKLASVACTRDNISNQEQLFQNL